MKKCLACYARLEEGQIDFHPKCARAFFGSETPPTLPYDLKDMEEIAKQAVLRSNTVPGVQPKLSVGFTKNKKSKNQRERLTILDALEGQFILKPQNDDYALMPENEHLTMKLAELFELNVVPSSLIRLQSGELCYITKRIDRNPDLSKNHMIDFLQITELADKYFGTHESLGKRIGELSVNTLFDKLRFFESVVFNFVVGNNDMHLKNYSMLLTKNGWELSPFYDLLNVKIILPKDKDDLALMLGEKRRNFTINYFNRFAIGLGLNEKQYTRIYTRLLQWEIPAVKLIKQSFLSKDARASYVQLIQDRILLFSSI